MRKLKKCKGKSICLFICTLMLCSLFSGTAFADNGMNDDANTTERVEMIKETEKTETNVEESAEIAEESKQSVETKKENKESDTAATVNGKEYESLKAAYKAADAAHPIILESDITLDSFLKVDKEVTIDLHDHSIYVADTEKQMVFWITSTGDLTLKGMGTVYGKELKFGIIYIASGGHAALYDQVVLQDNTSNNGGAVYNSGIFQMDGGTIQNTTAIWYGGAVYNRGTFHMNGGTIQRTKVDYHYSFEASGGAVYNAKNAVMTMSGGLISECSAASAGGIFMAENTQFTLSGGAIMGCKAEIDKYSYTFGGGGVYVAPSAIFEMSDGEISNNKAIQCGGGVSNEGTFIMSGGLISQNKAVAASGNSVYGGGVYNDGTMTLSDGIITQNSGTGGIYSAYKTTLTITGGAVFDNSFGVHSGYMNQLQTVDLTLDKGSDGETSVLQASAMKADGYTFTAWEVHEPHASRPGLYTSFTSWTTDEALPPKSYMENASGVLYYTAEVTSRPGVVEEEGIYINGTNGSNDKDGTSSENAVRTFEKAVTLARDTLADHPDDIITIYVSGEISIYGNEEWKLPEHVVLKRAQGYSGYLVNVKSGSSLTLKDITIDGNKQFDVYTDSLIHVDGTLYITDGAILQNNLAGISAYAYQGGAVYCEHGKVYMTGGILQNNESKNYGGGITVCGGSFTMSGGSIKHNRSASGGGVCAVRGGSITLNDGALIAKNYAYNGGGIHIGGNKTSEAVGYDKQMLIMHGGTISGNEAGRNGGGIFVQMNSEAVIYAGDIMDNASIYGGNEPFRGGGIYVNGGKYASFNCADDVPNGLLQLYNVEITDNTAGGIGGGFAACPTANIRIYVTNGGILHDNISAAGTSNVAKEIFIYKSTSRSTLYVSDFMLGGGMYQWTDEEGNRVDQSVYQKINSESISLNNIVHKDDIEKAQKLAKVHITGNRTTGGTYGGGIAANGDVIIGSKPQEDELDANITITKAWIDQVDEFHERPSSLTVDIQYGEYTLRGIKLTAENNWTTTLEHMPDALLQQDDPQVRVMEYDCDDDTYVEDSLEAKIDDRGVLHIRFTNKYTPTKGGLTVSKTVLGEVTDKAFAFTVMLDDRLINGTYGDMEFTNGVATFTLKHGETKSAKGLPDGMGYEVTEADYKAHGYTTITQNANGTIVKGENAEVIFVNTKKTPSKPDGQTGNLAVSKTVTGNAKDTKKRFTFTVTLDDPTISGSYGDMNFEHGVAVFTLQHGERKIAVKLPANTAYTVMESDADGYEVSATHAIGVVEADNTITAAFRNHKDDKPLVPAKPMKPQTPDTSEDPIKTGDRTNTDLYISLLFISAAGIALFMITRKKEKVHKR